MTRQNDIELYNTQNIDTENNDNQNNHNQNNDTHYNNKRMTLGVNVMLSVIIMPSC